MYKNHIDLIGFIDFDSGLLLATDEFHKTASPTVQAQVLVPPIELLVFVKVLIPLIRNDGPSWRSESISGMIEGLAS